MLLSVPASPAYCAPHRSVSGGLLRVPRRLSYSLRHHPSILSRSSFTKTETETHRHKHGQYGPRRLRSFSGAGCALSSSGGGGGGRLELVVAVRAYLCRKRGSSSSSSQGAHISFCSTSNTSSIHISTTKHTDASTYIKPYQSHQPVKSSLPHVRRWRVKNHILSVLVPVSCAAAVLPRSYF